MIAAQMDFLFFHILIVLNQNAASLIDEGEFDSSNAPAVNETYDPADFLSLMAKVSHEKEIGRAHV